MRLRQKVLTRAEAEGERFAAKLVNNAFLHALRTGIMEESIRNHLKPFLDKASFAPDHVLLAEVNNAMAEDAARTRKLEAGRQKRVKFEVNEVQVGGGLEKVMNPMMDAIHKLSAEMMQMKADFQKLSEGNAASGGQAVGGTKNKKKKAPICKNCEGTGVSRCDHCFKCLNAGHEAKDCKSKN